MNIVPFVARNKLTSFKIETLSRFEHLIPYLRNSIIEMSGLVAEKWVEESMAYWSALNAEYRKIDEAAEKFKNTPIPQNLTDVPGLESSESITILKSKVCFFDGVVRFTIFTMYV